ncbi:MAG TPA: GNAT family N-acetyltransferase [Candidatus Binatus sp.]|uniref:GNAT family N-acetyltransferase n=1 Tax=Candidatus Binatus sp. TaxID=2811406 RepID=UPI002F42A561
MSSFSSRAYASSADLDRLIDFAQQATAARWPRSSYMKVGDVVWMLYGAKPGDPNIRLWFDGSRLAAYVSFEPPLHVDFDNRPGLAQDDLLFDEILHFAEERWQDLARLGRGPIPKAYAMMVGDTLSSTALDSDGRRISLLERRGFSRADGFNVLYSRSLIEAPIGQPELDAGLCLRHATDADLDARVDVHRDAWSVWGQSKITVESYRRLRSAPLYDPELDVVLEDSDGRFLSYCIGWADTANAMGHFEPVGCRPDSTGRGYARAVTIEGLRRMRARGLRTALVSTASVNERARVLYPSCGFVEVDRAHYYVKRID